MADNEHSMGDAPDSSKTAASAAERKRKSRAKRADDQVYQAFESQRVESIRKRRVNQMSQSELKEYRKKTAQRVAKCRMMKKEKKQGELKINVQSLTTPSLTPPSSTGKGFRSRQALSKAVNRIMSHLPISPSKKMLAFSGVAKKIGIGLDENFRAAMSECHSRALSQETVDIVLSFFERSDIVWTAPGIKDEITLWEGGVKKKLRKYYLTMFLREAFQLFLVSHPDVQIGFSKFCALKPKNVLLLKDTPCDQCKCQKHENFAYMLNGLGVPYNNLFWDNILCESNDLCSTCWKGEYEMCGKGKKLVDNFMVKDQDVNWKEWAKNDCGRLRVENRSGCEGELLEKIVDSLPGFQEHVRIKRVQSDAFNSDKSDPQTSVLQCDFAMAYSCEYQTEVQSALWGRESVNLFTAAFYHGSEPCKSYLIVTVSQDKGKDTVSTFIRELLSAEEGNLKRKLIIYTDGPSAEFKNKFMVKLLADLNEDFVECKIEWKYFATSHGKGVVDGIGGAAKSLVRRSVMARGDGVIVQSSSDFAREVRKLMPKVNVKHVSQEQITDVVKMRDPWCGVKEMPGVSKTHFMTCETNGRVLLFLDNTSSKIINEVKYYDDYCMANVLGIVNDEIVNDEIVHCKLGDWVLVKYDGKIYPGEVTGTGFGESVQVSVMRKAHPGQNWRWPETKDEILYEKQNIVQIINPPLPVGTRGQFSFNGQF